ncbi:MAG: DNA repair protein RadC [Bacteroidales bacterium]|nr:DNA repair protein RadC [Bacteroidales bacterium]
MTSGRNVSEKIPLADWSDQDKPREKFVQQGPSVLSDAELIAILLRTGNATENAVELSKRILATCHNSLNTLANVTLEDLRKIHGIGQVKAVTLMAAFELGRRIRAEAVEQSRVVKNSADMMELIQPKIAHLKHEEFWIILLNQAANILKMVQIGKGGLTSTTVDVRLIMQEALVQKATGIILCHNHPSGSVRPSNLDKSLTNQVKEAAALLNIRVMDHIIVSGNAYFSFADEGIL